MVCSAVVLGCTLTRCDRVEIPEPTMLSPTHNRLPNATPPPSPPPSPTLLNRAHIPLAVSFCRSASSAWKQPHRLSAFSLSFSFRLTSKKGSLPPLTFLAHRQHHAGAEHASETRFQMGCVAQHPIMQPYILVRSSLVLRRTRSHFLPFVLSVSPHLPAARLIL